jgi:hypothetical protein
VTRSVLLPALVAVGLLVAVWAATAGPVQMLGVAAPQHSSTTSVHRHASDSPLNAPPKMPTYRQLTRDVKPTVDLSWLGELIGYAAVLAGAFAAFRLLQALWRNRWRRPDKPATVEFEPLPPDQMADVIAQDADARLAAVESGRPSDGIVACWLRLEDSVAACGVPPRPAETSTELVTRVLRALDVDPRAVAGLARLYREARFSDHVLGEDSRERAREALRSISQDLARAKVTA